MKKLLLLLAGLLFSILPSSAQTAIADITSTVVKSINDLTSGYYIINCNIPKPSADSDTKPSGSLYYNPNRSNRPFDVADGFITEGQSQVNENQSFYIWQVEITDNNLLKIKNVAKDIYLPVDADRNNNMSTPTTKDAATFVGVDKTMTDVLSRNMTGIVLKYSNESVSNAPWTVFANHETGKDPNLSYWTTGGGEIMFQFVKLENIDFSFKYPFKSSIAPTSEGFHSGTRWQLLTIKNKYLYYTDDNTNIKTTASYTYEDKYWWAFSINEDGSFAIYNKAAGPTKVLAAGAMSGTEGGGTFPKFVDSNNIPEGQNANWNYLTAAYYTDKNGFYIYKGTSTSEKLNLRNDLSFWTGGQDEGSTFWISTIENESAKYDALTTYQTKAKGYQAVGTLKDDVINTITTSLASPTPETLRNVQEMLNNNENVAIPMNTNAYYYLHTEGRSEKNYMTMNSGNLTGANYDQKNASLIWKFTGDAANGYTMTSQGRYAQKTAGATKPATTTDKSEEASLFKLNKVTDTKIGLWSIKPDNDGLHLDASYNIVGWTNGDASEWYLIPATSIETEITDAGYATVNYPFAVQLPQDRGIKAYTGKAINSTTFELTEVPEGKIPANTPVVLSGAQDTYTLTIDTENTDNPINSQLSGTLLPETIGTETTVYGLAKGDHGVGFYRMNSTDDRTIGANKAYLNAEDLSTVSQGVRGLVFSFNDNDGTTTGIESVAPEVANEEYYDLQGRRVMNPSKGIYVTKSGKKVLFTK